MAASLLGIFSAATGTGALTTGSRTTVAGSLITVHNSGWAATPTPSCPVPTDSKSNAYSEHVDFAVSFGGGNSFPMLALASNLPTGTRGASHTVSTGALTGSTSHTLVACEWDGVQTAPTILTATNSGFTATAGSVSISPAVPSLVVGMYCYDSTATTIAVSSPTLEAVEVDESNTTQDQNVGYKVTITGATTLNWQSGASRDWVAIAVAFSEIAVGVGYTPDLYKPYEKFPKFLLRNQQRRLP